MSIKACSNCRIRVAPWFRSTCDYCYNLPISAKAALTYEEDFKEKVKKGILVEKFVAEEAEKRNESIKMPKPDRKNDDSKQVGLVMMILFGILGAAIGGIGGLVLGALFGFSLTAIFYALQESFK